MIYEQLGRTDLNVSKICLGTMTFGQQNTEAEAHEQLDYAVDQGINFIDTAELYAVPGSKETQGLTEQYIGSWLQARGKRDDVIIATKITGPSAGITWIRSALNFSREQLDIAIHNSLRRLQTEYIDLYQLHWPERRTNFFGRLGYVHDESDPWTDNFAEVLDSLQSYVQAGKIRHIGLSNETPWGVMRCLQLSDTQEVPRPVSIQNPYNLLNRSYEVGLAEVSMREDIGLLAYSPLAFGLLSGKYHSKQDSDGDRINQFKQLSRYNGRKSWEATEKYIAIANKYELSPAQLSLAFVNAQPFVTSNIIGATTMDQLREDIGSIDISFTREMAKDINKVHKEISNPAP